MTENATERRRARRVDAHLNLQLHLDLPEAGETQLETLNVSSSGIYFRSSAYIEPMTKLSLSFSVPTGDDSRADVQCEGIVARVVPELPTDSADGYDVAVFFTTIDADSLRGLEGYVDQRLRSANDLNHDQ
jgi:c-di-GMP-binding flagellar brake protein YcgR